jgi:uncharacterized membrane protein
MDGAHLHLMLNHIPLLGTIFGLPVLIAGLVLKNHVLRNAGLIILVMAAIFAIPVYLTGEPAEEIVEHLPGVGHDFIERHEDSAMAALIAAIVTGVISLIALGFSWAGRTAVTTVAAVTIVSAMVTAGLMGRTANLGGEIRHTEIRTAQTAGTQNTEAEKNEGKKAKDDDH